MEEDIKILEEFIKYFEAEATSIKYRRNISITVGEDDIQAIENLINRVKKLEEKVKRYEKYLENKDKKFKEALEYEYQERELDYIPKSKIREKIEEYKKRKESCNDIESEIRLDVKIKAYEELLEDK